ncbi:ABC transporter substrate-binding protein [Acholeplasma laidlawii]|uniref:ABC transporter substrate-binding protein n=1 Tax=Acholeplasma laidlawii TaxID=2148 RepID=UPI0025407E60|nr:ABC transporter substrate-binding protein [Acholeplasma laidlawii]
MKKILFTLLVLLSALVLIACTPKDSNTYRTYTSGTAKLNPYSESLATASELFDYVTDSLYTGDYDWAKAIEEGTATKVGDFTNAASLPYARVPRMAAGEPVDVKGDGTVWEITLRTDLKFQDGTPINANTFDYSWRQLLDPDQLNVRASNLYDASNLPLVNAEDYTKQKSQKSDDFDEPIWDAGNKGTIETENAFAFTDDGDKIFHSNVDGYFVYFYPSEAATFGGNWAMLYAEDNAFGGWVRQDKDGNPTVLPDGTPNPEAGEVVGYYQGAKPKLMYADGTIVPLDNDGKPVGATAIPNDPVQWSSVGFKVTGTHKFQITLTEPKDAWYVKGQLMSGITGVVHEAKYEAGKSADKRTTTYGTIDNPLVSYGAYNLIEWQDGVLYLFEKNDDHYAADEYRIERIRYDVIADQSIAVNEFKAGRLDIVGASGEYFKEFKDSPQLKLTPSTVFFRFAFNIAERPDGTTNPILTYPEFRQAFYYAIDREEFASEVRAPAYANQGFIGPVYIATEYGSVSYRGSDAGKAVFAPLSPETTGFNPTKAKQLFDAAYAKSVADGNIKNGDKVTVEYTYYKVETNDTVADWVKQTVEAIFGDKFELKLNGVSSDALDAAWDNFDFDMTFGGRQGLNFNPVSLMGQVYNSISGAANMLEHGFNTGDIALEIELPNTKAALQRWVADFNEETASEAQLAAYGRWTAALANFGDTDTYSATFDNVYKAAASTFYNVSDVNYTGRNDDFDRITAAMEAALLEEMIAIPLFTSVSATVYSARVKFEATEYHAWMGWGGLKYMYLD